MVKLKQMMKNKFDEDTGLAVQLAKIDGINQPQKLYKFVSGEIKEIDNFKAIRKVIESMFKYNHEEVLTQYGNDLDPNKQFIRDAVEYASLFEKSEMTEVLLNKLKNSTNSKGNEWGYFYELKEKAATMSSSEIFKEITSYNFKTPEMPIFSNLMLMNAYRAETKYKTAEEMAEMTEALIEDLKDGYIKESYKKRLQALKVSLTLRNGDHKETERLGKEALMTHETTPVDIYILMNMGNAYIMHDYDKAMDYFKKAENLANEFNDEERLVQVKNSVDFCMCYWRKYNRNGQEVNESDYSDYNKAFYYISVGNIEAAEICLDSIEYGNMDDVDKAFYYFYKGLLTRDKHDFYKSVKHFKVTDDKHYRQMPIIELKRLGEDDILIEVLSA